jgi:tRNA A-37 threonylcarbamoyl transferase component Bud32
MANRVRIIRGHSWAERLQEELTQSPLSPLEWMEEHTKIVKSSTNGLSGLLRLDDEVCFLKYYRFTSPLHRILFDLGFARPLHNFTAARDLGAQGVAVPRPLACLQVPQGMLLLIEGLSGPGNLEEVWRRQPTDEEALRLMRCAGESLATLHQSGYAHGNCKWDNLFWDGHRVCLIDLDDARRSAAGGEAQARDLARFTANAERFEIGLEKYAPFLDAYLQGVNESRREVTQRMLPILVQLRKKNLASHGPRGQRLV